MPAIPQSAGVGWQGFQAKEFGRIADTVWRSHDGERSLAPLITRGLRHQHEHFDSYGVEASAIDFFVGLIAGRAFVKAAGVLPSSSFMDTTLWR